MVSKKKEPIGDGFDQTIGNVDASALRGDIIPNVVQIGIRLRCAAVPHQGNLSFGCKAGTTAPLNLLGELAHGFLSMTRPSPRANDASA